jgi:pilus assembly protein Flp/PilA
VAASGGTTPDPIDHVRTINGGFKMYKLMYRFRHDEEGAALVEYGMLIGLIAVICIAAVTLLGDEISNAFSAIASDLAAL